MDRDEHAREPPTARAGTQGRESGHGAARPRRDRTWTPRDTSGAGPGDAGRRAHTDTRTRGAEGRHRGGGRDGAECRRTRRSAVTTGDGNRTTREKHGRQVWDRQGEGREGGGGGGRGERRWHTAPDRTAYYEHGATHPRGRDDDTKSGEASGTNERKCMATPSGEQAETHDGGDVRTDPDKWDERRWAYRVSSATNRRSRQQRSTTGVGRQYLLQGFNDVAWW